jgi:hypothetical protein
MMKFKSTTFFFFLIGVQAAILFGFLSFSKLSVDNSKYVEEQKIVQKFNITDFCLSTESRHTRHISQPELMAPFQDLPGFHDHFPSSSFFGPPDSSLWRQD